MFVGLLITDWCVNVAGASSCTHTIRTHDTSAKTVYTDHSAVYIRLSDFLIQIGLITCGGTCQRTPPKNISNAMMMVAAATAATSAAGRSDSVTVSDSVAPSPRRRGCGCESVLIQHWHDLHTRRLIHNTRGVYACNMSCECVCWFLSTL